ncbi:MAG: hypothetical protein M3O31_05515, partial [Acidobacteriota bacterium]|nr:hypothetical protein [Acidobacteriota bacterium]
MSEIYAPGSIAGPQGPTGPAGSQGSVAALASSVLPTPVNLFNFAAAKENYATQSNGSVTGPHTGLGGGPCWSTNLLYCPGATQIVCNHFLADTGFGGFNSAGNLFDANGAFTSALPSLGSWNIPWNTVITLPGTQTYVQLTLLDGPCGYPPDGAMVVVGSTIPGSFVSFAPYVSSVVDANLAAASLASKNYAVANATALTNFLVPTNANLFDPSACSARGHVLTSDGGISTSPWYGGDLMVSGYIFCPGATSFVSNIEVLTDGYA